MAGRPARRGGRRPGVLRAARAGAAGRVLRRARAGRPRHLVADRAGPDRRVRRAARHGLRHAGPDRQRGLRAAAAGDRRAARADDRRHGRQHHHAAQAQSRGQRAPGHRWPGWSGPTPRVLVEGMVVGHERDGRGWKAEWVALPEVCLLTGVALQLARRLLSGLVVDADAMRANLERSRRPAGVRADPRRADASGWASTPPSS